MITLKFWTPMAHHSKGHARVDAYRASCGRGVLRRTTRLPAGGPIRSLGVGIAVTVLVACSPAPWFTIGPPVSDAGVDPTDAAPIDGGAPDAFVDGGPRDAGPRVDPPTPARDALLGDPACVFAYQAPRVGPSRAVTELTTDARCGGPGVHFVRPGAPSSWRGHDLLEAPLFDGAPHAAVASVLPPEDFAALPAINLSLLADAPAAISPPLPTWSFYFVARAAPHVGAPPQEQPLLNVAGVDAAGTTQDFAFSLYFPPGRSFLAMTTVVGVERQGILFGTPGAPVDVSGNALLCGVRNTGARVYLETLRKGPSGTVRTSVYIPAGPQFAVPALQAGGVRLLGTINGAANLQGALGEVLLVGRALTDDEHANVLADLALVHGF